MCSRPLSVLSMYYAFALTIGILFALIGAVVDDVTIITIITLLIILGLAIA